MTYPFDGGKNDIVTVMFRFLDDKSLSSAALVCKNWLFAAEDEWKTRLKQISNYVDPIQSASVIYKEIIQMHKAVSILHLAVADRSFESENYDGLGAVNIRNAKIIFSTPKLCEKYLAEEKKICDKKGYINGSYLSHILKNDENGEIKKIVADIPALYEIYQEAENISKIAQQVEMGVMW